MSQTYRPEVNQRISKAAHIKELNSEIDKLKEELFATREKNGVYLPADHWESQQVSPLSGVLRCPLSHRNPFSFRHAMFFGMLVLSHHS